MLTSKTAVAPEGYRSEQAQSVPPVFGKKYPTNWFTDFLARYPTAVLCIGLLIPFALVISSLGSSVGLNVDNDSFRVANNLYAKEYEYATQASDAWQRLLRDQQGTGSSTIRSTSERTQPKYRITFTYALKNTSKWTTLLNPAALGLMNNVETRAQNTPGYVLYCWTNNFHRGTIQSTLPRCVPPNSILTYFYPGTLTSSSGNLYFPLDGSSRTLQQPIADMVSRIRQNPNYPWYFDPNFQFTGRATAMRSQIIFGWPASDRTGRLYDERQYRILVQNVLRRMIEAVFTVVENHPDIEFFVSGDLVTNVVVNQAIDDDYWRIVVAMLCLLLLLWIQMRSGVLATMGLLQVLLTYLVAQGIVGWSKDGNLPVLSAIGFVGSVLFTCDGIVIFYNTFIHSGITPTSGRRNLLSVPQRVAYTFRRAFFGILVAHLTALGAFGAALISAIPVLQDFAFFMMIIVLVDLYMFAFVTPACIVFHHYYFSKRRRNLQRQKEIFLRSGFFQRFPAFQALLRSLENLKAVTKSFTYRELQRRADEIQSEWTTKPSDTFGSLVARTDFFAHGAVHEWTVLTRRKEVLSPRALLPDGEEDAQGEMPKPAQDEEKDSDDDDRAARLARVASQEEARLRKRLEEQFMTANDFAASSSHNLNGTPTQDIPSANRYNSMRLVPQDSVLHIPAHLCFRTPSALVAARAVLSNKRLMTSDASLDSNYAAELEPEEEEPLVMPHFEEPLEIYNVSLSTVPPLVKIREFEDFWVAAADILQVETGKGTSVASEIVPLAAYAAVSHQLGRDAVTFSSGIPGRAMRNAFFGPEDGGQSPNAASRRGVTVMGESEERPTVERKWCCGRCGERVNETRAEKDSRILSKKIKHEGYGRVERFLNNYFASFVYEGRYPLLVLFFLIFSLSIWGATTVKNASGLVGDVFADSRVRGANRQFGFDNSDPACDYCSGYYTDSNKFRPMTATINRVCTAAGYYNNLNAYLDRCGVCYGNNNCTDCAGIPNGTRTVDSCGRCGNAFDNVSYNSCLQCRNDLIGRPECGYCKTKLGISYRYGPSCAIRCDNTVCPANRGRCDPISGQCICHRSPNLGFFTGDKCASCINTYEDGPNGPCTMNCNGTTNDCTCENYLCRCRYGYGGLNCAVRFTDLCIRGNLRVSFSTSQQGENYCDCVSPAVGEKCDMWPHQCSGHGIYYTAAEAPAAGCYCKGFWRGSNCSFCDCANGGTCDIEGRCVCRGAWSGTRCHLCPESCPAHGALCPQAWTPDQYSVTECVANFCSESDMNAGIICAPCYRNQTSLCGSYLTFAQCQNTTSAAICWWNSTEGRCVDTRNFSSPIGLATSVYNSCQGCNGYWSGPACNICSSPSGVCTPDGTAIGCDNLEYTSATIHLMPSFDRCGICAGQGLCDACPNKNETRDVCGTCGGDKVFLASCITDPTNNISSNNGVDQTTDALSARPLMDVYFGLAHFGDIGNETGLIDGSDSARFHTKFEFATARTMLKLWEFCQAYVLGNVPSSIQAQVKSCLVLDWVNELVKNSSNPFSVSRNNFPDDEYRRTILLYEFAKRTGRLSEVAFRTVDTTNADKFRVAWVKAQLYPTHQALASDPATALAVAETFNSRFRSLEATFFAAHGSSVPIVQTSLWWIDAAEKLQAGSSIGWSLGIGAIIMCFLVHIFTCSFSMMMITLLSASGSILLTLAFYSAFGWTLGAVEQIMMSIILGLVVEFAIHSQTAYLDTIHTQSQAFAHEMTRLQAVRGAVLRSGLSIIGSGACVLVVSLCYITSNLNVFRRAAEAVILITLISMLFSMVFSNMWLSLFGPMNSYRVVTIQVTLCLMWFIVIAIGLVILSRVHVLRPDGKVAIP